MIIKISGNNLKINKRIKKVVEKKLAKGLDKLLPEELDRDLKKGVLVIEKHSRWGYKVSFEMKLPEHYQLYAQERKETITKTLVSLREKLQKQLKKYRENLKIDN